MVFCPSFEKCDIVKDINKESVLTVFLICSALSLGFFFLSLYSTFTESLPLIYQLLYLTTTMPPSRVGPTGHRRVRLEKMRVRGQAQEFRSPSPDIEDDEEMRMEHFSYYNLPYSRRKPKAENTEIVLFKDPFQEDQRYKNQVTLPLRRRQTISPFSTVASQKSLPIRDSSTNGHSSAIGPLDLGGNIRSNLGDLQETRKHSEPMQQSPTDPSQSEPLDRIEYNNGVKILMSGLRELSLQSSHADALTDAPVTSSSRRGAVDFRGVPSVEQLSAALAADLRLKPSLQDIADSLFQKDIMPEVFIPGYNELEQLEEEYGEHAYQDQDVTTQLTKLDEGKERGRQEEEEEACL